MGRVLFKTRIDKKMCKCLMIKWRVRYEWHKKRLNDEGSAFFPSVSMRLSTIMISVCVEYGVQNETTFCKYIYCSRNVICKENFALQFWKLASLYPR